MTKAKDRTQITPQLQNRVNKLKRKARDYIVKTEILQFRLDEDTYRDLFSLAEAYRKPVGTLVREWITNKVQQERAKQRADSSEITTLRLSHINAFELAKELKALGQSVIFLSAESEVDKATTAQVAVLKQQIEELKQHLSK